MVIIRAKQTFHDSETGLMAIDQTCSVTAKRAEELRSIGLVDVISEDDGKPPEPKNIRDFITVKPAEERKPEAVLFKDDNMKDVIEPILAPEPEPSPGPDKKAVDVKEEEAAPETKQVIDDAEIEKKKQSETPKKKYK